MKQGSRAALAAAVLAAACSGPSAPDPVASGSTISLQGASVLVFEDDGRLEGHRDRIEQIVSAANGAVRALMPVNAVRISVRVGGPLVIREIGMGGRALGTDGIELAFDPDSSALAASIETALLPLVAHEMHHIMRHRTAGFSDNLLEAMILEGLADHFAVEVAGSDPPIWSTALTDDQLATWEARAQAQWFDSGYDHKRWFFGTADVPVWAGYSIGFELVRDFLERNPGRRPSDLYSEPAATLVQ